MARRVIFSDEARADIRAIDRDPALRLLEALARFLETDAGDVKQLHVSIRRSTASGSATGASSSAKAAPIRSMSSASAIAARLTGKRRGGSVQSAS
jgi:hypothetical protein